mmetsp:Transcript_28307/g.45537  ORF Transcript_28307/g.45537 Transcript_28307/m.45537 type:complete len:294 (-) Transcript_28307:293-1174(-)
MGVHVPRCLLLLLHEWDEVCDCLLHHTCGFDNLGEEHLPGTEQVAHSGHALHQRALNDLQWLVKLLTCLLRVFIDVLHDPLDQGVSQAVLNAEFAPFRGLLLLRAACSFALPRLLGVFQQIVRSFLVFVQNGILEQLQQVLWNVGVQRKCASINDTHVHTISDGVVEEDGMHRFTQVVESPEREGKIGETTRNMGVRQVLTNPFGSFDEVHGVGVVLSNSGSNRQDVRVEDDVPRRKLNLLAGQNVICALTNPDLILKGGGLALLVKRHHHNSTSVTLELPCLLDEEIFPSLQ